jgi:hypothetical protein
MAIMVELAFRMNDLLQNESYELSDTAMILSTWRTSSLIRIIYHFIKIKLDISIPCDNIIRNIFINGFRSV